MPHHKRYFLQPGVNFDDQRMCVLCSCAVQMLGTLTAVPIKVPQVSSLHRLAGQAATVLPQVSTPDDMCTRSCRGQRSTSQLQPVVSLCRPLQVRPKTQIPDSLPHSLCQELQPLSLQRATAVVSPRSQGATLPTANSTLSPDHQPNGQSDASSPPAQPQGTQGGPDSAAAQHASAGPGVAYAIIAASPANGNGVSAVSEAVKVPLISDLCSFAEKQKAKCLSEISLF